MRSDRQRHQAGFSMVELMIVITVMGIVLASSYVSLRHAMPAHELAAAANKLGADLRLARQRAVAESNNYTITFDPSSDAYAVWDDDGSDGYRSPGENVRVVRFPEGVHLVAISIGASNSVTFRPNGSTDKGGFIDIRNEQSNQRRTRIVRATGSVHQEDVDG